jgi:hypothetical protein
MRALNRAELLELTPRVYLAAGYLGGDGKLIPQFRSEYATAASTQLLEAELSPQELAFTVEGLRQILPMHKGPVQERLTAALDECLHVVARAIRQENNKGLVEWLSQCASAVETDAELAAFMAHIEAVMRLYSLLVMGQPDGSK